MTQPLDIQYVPLSDLTPWPGNARVGEVERIKASMREHGVFNPLIVQKSTGQVMVGNHRLAALTELHEENPERWDGTAPVAYYDVDETQATKINLIDNKLSDDADMDDEALAAQLQAIQDEEGDLTGTGYTTSDLEDILESLDTEVPGSADVAEAREDSYTETYAINIVVPDETTQRELYEEFVERGLEVKVVTI